MPKLKHKKDNMTWINQLNIKAFNEISSIMWKQILLIIATQKRWQRLLSVSISMWAESHKICNFEPQSWTQVLRQCFCSNGLRLILQIIVSVGIRESIDINQSISVNQFYSIEASKFIRDCFCFSIIHHNNVLNYNELKSCEKSLSFE